MTDRNAILARETAHLPQRDRDLIAARLNTASALLSATPHATETALTDKLQSFGGCPRWVCVLIACAALATPARASALAA